MSPGFRFGWGTEIKWSHEIQFKAFTTLLRVTFPPCIIMNQYFKISQYSVSLQPFNMKTAEI